MPDFHDRLRALRSPGRVPVRAAVPGVKGDGTTAVLRLYDPIDSWGGSWGVSAKEFVQALDELPDSTTEIRLHINSPGGEVWECLAILNALRGHDARVVAVVEGLAASAASVIATGADELLMAPNSELMVHNAWGVCVGDADDMRKAAGKLDQIGNNIASIYAKKAGGTLEEWRAVMAAETWYSAEEAVAVGLADRVLELPGDTADETTAKNRFDLTVFAYAGREHAPAPKPPAAPAAGPVTPTEGSPAVAFSDEQLTTLRQRLGVAESADETAILAALDEALSEQADPPQTTPPTPTAAAVPEGMALVPQAVLDGLQAAAATTTQLAARQHETDRQVFLDANARKFPPAARASMEAWYDQDQTAVRAHLEKAPDAFAVAELGHDTGGDVEEFSAEALDEFAASLGLEKGALR